MNNFVAKNMNRVNKNVVHKDKNHLAKKYASRKAKHKTRLY